MAPTGGSRQHSKTSAMEGKPDGRRTRPEPALLTRSGHSRTTTAPGAAEVGQ
jgi:hypothetical protein